MTQELRIRLGLTIPWPANRVDSAARSEEWDRVFGAFLTKVEKLDGHLHASEKMVAARKRGVPALGPSELPVPEPDESATTVMRDQNEREGLDATTGQPGDYFGPLPGYLTSKGAGA